jgi:putative peptide zinc metalloprotease protein
MSRARLVALPPGAPLTLPTAGDAAVVAAGQLVTPDGTELGPGFLIGPAGELFSGAVAHARSHVRVWMLPALAGLPLLLGSPADGRPAGGSGGSSGSDGGPGDAGRAPSFGAHPRAAYPPLAAPPGPPPSTSDDVDRRFERKLWWLLILLLLFALLLTGANFLTGPAWSEMREDHALLHVSDGTVTATIDGTKRVLGRGDEAYVSSTDVVQVGQRSDARLTFRVTWYAAGPGGLAGDGLREGAGVHEGHVGGVPAVGAAGHVGRQAGTELGGGGLLGRLGRGGRLDG